MSDAYMPQPNCPGCDAEINDDTTECPSCGASLVFCNRGGHIVTEEEYRSEESMCDDCWHRTIDQ